FLRLGRARLGCRRRARLGLGLARRRLRLARARRRLRAVEQRHPALAPRDRPALLDAEHVARLDEIVLVMRRVVLRAHDEFLVDRMHDAPLDAHDHRLVPRVAEGHTLEYTLRHRCSLSLTRARARPGWSLSARCRAAPGARAWCSRADRSPSGSAG